MKKPFFICFLVGVLQLGAFGMANASLIVNGTFDTNLTGWQLSATGSTIWEDGTAHIGQPGTNMVSSISQTFNSGTASFLLIEFDYQWQINRPTLNDTFTVGYSYTNSSGPINGQLLFEQSDSPTFNTTIPFSNTLLLSNPISDITLEFKLAEVNSPVGTRIQLDNVIVNAVPIPSTVWLLGCGVIGLVGLRRKLKN